MADLIFKGIAHERFKLGELEYELITNFDYNYLLETPLAKSAFCLEISNGMHADEKFMKVIVPKYENIDESEREEEKEFLM